jgi:YHS domain-containing protein
LTEWITPRFSEHFARGVRTIFERFNMTVRLLSLSVCALLVGAFVANSEDKKADVKPLCPVSGKAIDMTKSVAYKGGKVYFCCGGCPGAFEKETAKFATKANHQLVVTKQATQGKCPLSGGPLNDEKTVAVAGVTVKFCCEKCQGKVAGSKAEEQLELTFSDKAFDKGFTVAD